MPEFRMFRSRDEHVPHERLRALCRKAEQDDPSDRIAPCYTVTTPPPDTTDAPPDASVPGVLARLRARARDWLPDALVNSRFDPGRTGLVALSLAVLAGAGVLAVMLWPDDASSPAPAARPAPPLPPAVETPSTTDPAPTPTELVVSVVGRVAEPGLVTLQPGDRVDDALRRAGGPLPGTDVTALNLARPLDDGEQLYVGIPAPPGSSGSETADGSAPAESGDADGSVDLNTADAEELQELSGVGEVTAEQIVQWRDEHGEFGSVDQLRDVDGIGEATVERLRDQVQV